MSAEAKVDDFELSIVVDENVLGFEVSMGDSVGVQVVYSGDDLVKVGAGLRFRDSECGGSYFFSLIIFLKS